MRIRDDKKRENIISSAMRIINEYGFADISMNKIASEAGVSPATIYIYFLDKEDLIKNIFISVKSDLEKFLFSKVDFNSKLEVTVKELWKNFFDFCTEQKDKFIFLEQFIHSPSANKTKHGKLNFFNDTFTKLINNGKKSGILKNLPDDIILVFALSPIIQLAKSHISGEINLTSKNFQLAFQSAWDAISL
ncbi:MAG: TetR/AcrR family transcriptional regulator [Spirochaetes bacterium]|nr:TetR/AcrR family transcriptional regulator [Spirochaetota bacterium]